MTTAKEGLGHSNPRDAMSTAAEEWRAFVNGSRRDHIRSLVINGATPNVVRELLGGLTEDEEVWLGEQERFFMNKCGKRLDAVSKCVLEPKHDGPCSPRWIIPELRRQMLAAARGLDWSIAERALEGKRGWIGFFLEQGRAR